MEQNSKKAPGRFELPGAEDRTSPGGGPFGEESGKKNSATLIADYLV
jgi:hypothetical protein